jgi:hypothetical protein
MNEVIPGVYQLNNQFVNLYLIVEPDGPVTWDYQRGLQSAR